MASDQIVQFASVLRQMYLFRGYNDAQLAHFITLFKPLELGTGKEVYKAGSPGDFFYIISQGRVKVTVEEDGEERLVNILGSGEHFGEEALIEKRPHESAVTTLEPTVLFAIDRGTFFRMLDMFSEMEVLLEQTAESRALAKRAGFQWLGEDEVVYLAVRRHGLFLWRNLLLPLFLGLGSLPVFAFALTDPINNVWILLTGAAMLFLAGFLTIWFVVDWSNDYFVVTNQRVIKIEKVVLLYTNSREAPLTHILAVNVGKTLFGRIFHYGDVEVRTFTGGIRMRRTSKPDLFAPYIEGFKSRNTQARRQAEIEEIRRTLDRRMGLQVEGSPPPPRLLRPGRLRERNDADPGSFRFFVETLFNIRYEQKGVITYRKYWPLLLAKTWLPTTLMILLVGFTFYQLRLYYLGTGGFMATFPMFLFYGMIWMALFAWWVYNYLDWSNDIYQLAPDQIRDIERKPLGDEIKKTAPLESILSLEHTRDGIIQILLNYGNVIINVGQTNFIFRGVYNPDQVHQDVSDYIEALNRHKREAEWERERERMADFLITFKTEAERKEALENEMNWRIFPG